MWISWNGLLSIKKHVFFRILHQGITMVQEDDIVLFKGDNNDNEVLLLQSFDDVHTAAINCLEFNKEGLLATASG